MEHLHAPANAAHQRAGLVLSEIPAQAAVEHRANGQQVTGLARPAGRGEAMDRLSGFEVPVLQQACRHLRGLEDEVHEAARGGAPRHPNFRAVVERRFAEGQASRFLDGLDPYRPIVSEPGQDDPDSVFTLILGQ